MLECRALAVAYGRHLALKKVDIRVAPGEIVVILGANGAGKTTLLKAIAGLVPVDAASQVLQDGKPVTRLAPHHIVEAGLALVPEGRGIFGDLSVKENLLLGAFAQRARADQDANYERVLGLFPKLAERSAQQARTMSGGEQQMVAIGRALMSAPAILMLDEPSLGLSPLLCAELFKALSAVRKTGVGILLVEQNARQSLAIADRAYLLENGEIVGAGPAEQLARDPAVQAAYLGGAAAKAPVHGQGAAAFDAATAALKASPSVATQSAASSALLPATAVGRAVGAPVDAGLSGRIADLVKNATQVQAAHVLSQRGAYTGQPVSVADRAATPGGVAPPQDLLQALARITEAARSARQPAPVPAPMANAANTTHPTPNLPAIEIYRRPKLEIYRRSRDGSMVKEN